MECGTVWMIPRYAAVCVCFKADLFLFEGFTSKPRGRPATKGLHTFLRKK
jgi:hypothetical protein